MLKKNYRNSVTALAVGVFLLGGCSGKFISPSDIGEIQKDATIEEYTLSGGSLMQKIMAYEHERGGSAVFLSGSSDRFSDIGYSENPYEAILRLSSIEKNIIVNGAMAKKGSKDLFIKSPPSIVQKMKSLNRFSAEKFTRNDVETGEIRVQYDKSIASFLSVESLAYDNKTEEIARSLYSFMEYLSGSAQLNGKKLYFGYSQKNKILSISENHIPLMSSPYRSYILKKRMDESNIPYFVSGDTKITINGTFGDWAKAYQMYEKIDPYASQTYVVSANGATFEVQEGYYEERPIRIEFIGWNDDGSRTYVFYDNEYANKIITFSRMVQFATEKVKYQVRFF